MQTAIIIPARMGSTRFPGKPLALLDGRPIISHVLAQAQQADADIVVVATDDEQIADTVRNHNGKAIITAPELPNGTARVAAALHTLPQTVDVVINVQGDEPFVSPKAINNLITLMQRTNVEIGTLQVPITDPSWLQDPNKVKVVCNQRQEALYFSRAAIPFQRDTPADDWTTGFPYHLHVGMYGFKASVLPQLMALPPSPLAEVESLEQLQWLDHDYRIHVATTLHHSFGIDTPADLKAAEDRLQKKAR